MSNATSSKPTPIPAILVYGTPTSPELTQASWFRAEDKQAAKAAAEALKFSMIDIQTDAEKALTVGVPEGVLKGSGRMIVGSVSSEVYHRIENYVGKVAGAQATPKPINNEAAATKPSSEQTANIDPWAALGVGSYAVVKYWGSDGQPNGWWIGIITSIDKNAFIIRWPDEPRTPPLKVERKHVAILHPAFDVAREWDRRR